MLCTHFAIPGATTPGDHQMADSQILSDASLNDFLAALASADAGRATAWAAAVAASTGTSLLLMVTALPQTRSDSTADRTALLTVATALSEVQKQLMETIDTDTVVKI